MNSKILQISIGLCFFILIVYLIFALQESQKIISSQAQLILGENKRLHNDISNLKYSNAVMAQNLKQLSNSTQFRTQIGFKKSNS